MRPRFVLTASGTKAPLPGAFMAGPTPASRPYRITKVVAVTQAGSTKPPRYRLTCIMTPRGAVAAPLHPWKLNTATRPRGRPAEPALLASPRLAAMGIRDRTVLERIRFTAPLLFAMGFAEPLRRSRHDDERAALQRAARVGQDRGVVNLTDHGPPIRQQAVLSDTGMPLREADVETQTRVPDPDDMRRRIRRARRVDPVRTLYNNRAITPRHYAAAEALRADIESSTQALGMSSSEIHAAPWDRTGVTDRQIRACRMVRTALVDVAERDRMVLAWMLAGGTVAGVMAVLRMHRATALTALRASLDAVADAYNLGDT